MAVPISDVESTFPVPEICSSEIEAPGRLFEDQKEGSMLLHPLNSFAPRYRSTKCEPYQRPSSPIPPTGIILSPTPQNTTQNTSFVVLTAKWFKFKKYYVTILF
jgi:hypothetical protein